MKGISRVTVFPSIHVSAFERVIRGSEAYAPQPMLCDFDIVKTPNTGGRSRDPYFDVVAVKRSIDDNVEEDRGLFQQARIWINCRRWAHMALFTITLAIVVTILGNIQGADGNITQLLKNAYTTISGGFGPIFSAFKQSPWLSASLLVLLATFWIAGSVLKRKIHNIYSRYWRQVVRPFRSSLNR